MTKFEATGNTTNIPTPKQLTHLGVLFRPKSARSLRTGATSEVAYDFFTQVYEEEGEEREREDQPHAAPASPSPQGSSYKRQLETSAALKEKTTNNVTRIMLSFMHKEVHSSDEDEAEGQDAECIYCSRLFSRDKKREKKWFGDDGELITLPDPIRPISLRLPMFDEISPQLDVEYKPAAISDFENKYIVQPGDIGDDDRYLLEVDICSLSFSHHPLFSREHVIAQRVTDLFLKHSHSVALGQIQRLTGRLEALRRARDSLKKALDQASDANQQQLERLQRYVAEVRETRHMRQKEGYNNRQLLSKLLMTWPKKERQKQAEQKIEESDDKQEKEELLDELEAPGEEPKPPAKVDMAVVKSEMMERLSESFRPPGEPQLHIELNNNGVVDQNPGCPNEQQRRAAVKRCELYVKIFYNQKEVCCSRPQALGPRFNVSIGQLFPIRILQWPESLKVELHEEGGTLAHHLIAEIYIPIPGSETTLQNCSVEHHEFSSNQVISFSHAAVGSGSYICPFPEGSNKEQTCLNTSGVLTCRVGWGVDLVTYGNAQEKILAPPEKYWTKGRRHSGSTDLMTMLDMEGNAGVGTSTEPNYFRLDPLQTEFDFCEMEDIEKNPRLRLLRLRDQGEPEFRGLRLVPLREKEIPKDVFRIYEKRLSATNPKIESLSSDPLESHRDWGQRFLQKVRQRVLKQCRLAQQHRQLQDVVMEDQVPDIGTLGLTFMKWLQPKRPLRPTRKERKKVTMQNLAGQEVKIIVNVIHAFEVPIRKDVDSLNSSVGGNAGQQGLRFSMVPVRPFVEVSFQGVSIEGTFKLYSPPVLLGYEKEPHHRQFSGFASPGDSQHALPPRDSTFLTLFITVQPALNPPEPFKEKLESSELTFVEEHLENWESQVASQVPHRKVKTLVIDIILVEDVPVTEEMAARFVSMIPMVGGSMLFPGLFDIWLTKDHAVLLCCYLMHFGKKAWLLLGAGIPHGPTAYVLTREEEEPKNFSYWLWDPASGQKYSIEDNFCPLQKVYCLINDENIWMNVQKEELPWRTRFDITRRSDWWPAFGRAVGAPMGSVQPTTLNYTPTSLTATQLLQDRIEKQLKDSLMKWRRTARTLWNRYCIAILRKLLPTLEHATWNQKDVALPDHIQELQHILGSHKMCGFPINLPYTNMDAITEAMKATGVHFNESPDVEFALAVYIHPFPNNVLSVWVYVASLIKRR
ncbi:hypothetical protein C0J52_10989 [Blattella germanica]|nr:hypothetical protein C0J52_10989 [Blattella germanica]